MKKFLLALLFVNSVSLLFAQSGQLDPSFGSNGIATANMGSASNYSSKSKQALIGADGSIYVILDATFISKRLHNGLIDSSYGFNGYSSSVPAADAFAVQQADGKIVIAGNNSDGNAYVLARFKTDGRLDSTFGINGIQTTQFGDASAAKSVAIQADGKIVVAGGATLNNINYFTLIRYTAAGIADNTFNGNGVVLTTFDSEFQIANTVAIDADGKIVAAGYADAGTGFQFAIARYNANGSLDNTFDTDGRQTAGFGPSTVNIAYSIAFQADKKIILAGFTSLSASNFALARFTTNGSLDNTFSGDGLQTAAIESDMLIANSVAIQSTGNIVVAGYASSGPNKEFAIARFTTAGLPDNTFGTNGTISTDINSSDDYAGSVAIGGSNEILVAGYAEKGSETNFALARYTVNGLPDNTFGTNGKLQGDFKQGVTKFNATAVQPDGKVIAAGITFNGIDNDFAIARFNSNGTPDNSFGIAGKQITDFGTNDEAISIALQPNGKILVAGNTGDAQTKLAIARYNADGTLDNTFNATGTLTTAMGVGDNVKGIAVQQDGKIVVAGYTGNNADYDSVYFVLARFDNMGATDNSFGNAGRQFTQFGSPLNFAAALDIESDGKIVVAGRSFINGQNNFAIARYNTNGSLDNSFSQDGRQTSTFGGEDYFGQNMAIQNDGKIIVAGYSQDPFTSANTFAAARYTAAGILDNTFSTDGYIAPYPGIASSIAINEDGRVAIGGDNGNFEIVLLKTNGSLDSTFGTNGLQTSYIGLQNSAVTSLAFADNNKLYAAGAGQFPGTLGVAARYLLAQEGPLPVTLADIKATLQPNQTVLVQWHTESEQALTGFTVLRSNDGSSFLPIGYVAAKGNSNVKLEYALIDKVPLNGINYYRLQMLDADGKFSLSKIVTAELKQGVFTFKAYPNPTQNILFVQATGNETATFAIIDAAGRKLQEKKIVLNGNTTFPATVGALPKGLYILQLHTKNKIETVRFVKQ